MSDLDLLMRVARPRTLVVLAAAIFLVAYGNWALRYPRLWYRELMYPPAKDVSGQGRDIEQALEGQKSLEVVTRYRRVDALLQAAGAQGFDVSGLEREALEALDLNKPGYRTQALLVLSRVELEIPRKRQPVIPASDDASDLRVAPDVRPSRVSRRRRRRRG